jgi:hypothetical protein
MCNIPRLSRQLANCFCGVLGHRFGSQHIGGGWGGACEMLGARVNVLQGRYLTNKCKFACVVL